MLRFGDRIIKGFRVGTGEQDDATETSPLVATEDYARFGLDPNAPLMPGTVKPIREWTDTDLCQSLDAEPHHVSLIKLALAVLDSDPLIAVEDRPGLLLLRTCRAAVPSHDDPLYRTLAAVREKLWRYCDLAAQRQDEDIERHGQSLGLGDTARRVMKTAIADGIPLPPNDPFRPFARNRNILAQARAILAPAHVLFSATRRQLYATLNEADGPEILPASQQSAAPVVETFASDTAFVIVADGASVRLCHFAECGADNWHGRVFGTPLSAMHHASITFGVEEAGWRDGQMDTLLSV